MSLLFRTLPVRCYVFVIAIFLTASAWAQVPAIKFTVSIPNPASHTYHVKLSAANWTRDTIFLKMPNWTPGYYQLMNYGSDVQRLAISGANVSVQQVNPNTWRVTGARNKAFQLDYDILTKRSFVATSYVDTARAYIMPSNSFLYVDGALNLPVTIQVEPGKKWNKMATGLRADARNPHLFQATSFDELYDCPILIGNLEELPSFKVRGANHRFIGYKLGEFNKPDLVQKLQKMIVAATDLFGDVPYKEYTFIAIGPGRGGIEHANNTTVSFDGSNLHTAAGMNTMLNFLAHEYIHHFNVKRIRPFELGPFNYEKENRTTQLWISEGLTVYYEYIILKRAGLASEETMLANLEANLNAHERNPGRLHQSLVQASYKTWREGPFGTQGDEKGKTISYYDKGPLVGMLLDLSIRQSTTNKKSLDDVMRYLYQRYYQQLGRGFTEAEFREACEQTAGRSLDPLFEYVYTTKELDYNTYLNYAGLQLERANDQLRIIKLPTQTESQKALYSSWMQGD